MSVIATNGRYVNLEIDRDDVLEVRRRPLRDGDVALVVLIRVERGAIRKRNRQAGVVRARRADDVGANLQVDHAV